MPDSIDPPAGAGIDWDKAHERLTEIAAELDGSLSEAAFAAKMRQRAEALAEAEEAENVSAKRDVMIFGLAGQRYAIEVARAAGVIPLTHVVALPGVDRLHLGLVVHRGLLHALIDVNVLLDRPVAPAEPPAFAVLLDEPDCAIGLAANEIHGIAREEAERLDQGAGRPAIVGAILPDGTSVLAPEAVARNARLIVDHRLRDALPS